MTENESPVGRDQASGSDHARIVAEVLEDQARRRAAQEAARPRPAGSDTSFFVQVGLLVAGTFFFYLLFFSPMWVVPAAPDPVAAAQVEEGLRFHIYITASQVEAFRDDRGRLPSGLDELEGVAKEGVAYQTLGDGVFEITATTGDRRLRYVSTEPLDEFAAGVGTQIMEGTS